MPGTIKPKMKVAMKQVNKPLIKIYGNIATMKFFNNMKSLLNSTTDSKEISIPSPKEDQLRSILMSIDRLKK